MIYALKKIPQELRRFAMLAAVAGMLTTAVIYSRDDHVRSQDIENRSKQAFQQPKDRQQAEGWFIPTPSSAMSQDKVAEITNAIPLPRARPITPGFYYELVRAQGDGEEGDYVLVERNVFQTLTCLNPVTCPNEAAGISHSAVSEEREELDATRSLTRARAGTYTGSPMATRNTV
jgi:hypothetical protein